MIRSGVGALALVCCICSAIPTFAERPASPHVKTFLLNALLSDELNGDANNRTRTESSSLSLNSVHKFWQELWQTQSSDSIDPEESLEPEDITPSRSKPIRIGDPLQKFRPNKRPVADALELLYPYPYQDPYPPLLYMPPYPPPQYNPAAYGPYPPQPHNDQQDPNSIITMEFIKGVLAALQRPAAESSPFAGSSVVEQPNLAETSALADRPVQFDSMPQRGRPSQYQSNIIRDPPSRPLMLVDEYVAPSSPVIGCRVSASQVANDQFVVAASSPVGCASSQRLQIVRALHDVNENTSNAKETIEHTVEKYPAELFDKPKMQHYVRSSPKTHRRKQFKSGSSDVIMPLSLPNYIEVLEIISLQNGLVSINSARKSNRHKSQDPEKQRRVSQHYRKRKIKQGLGTKTEWF